MSIIYEALKKAQTRFIRPAEEKTKNNGMLWFTIGFIFMGFLGCGFALMLLINSASKQKTVVKLVEAKKEDFEKKPALNLPLVSKPNSPQLVLNGIMTMEGEYTALINNQILKEGDYIQDMRIISITKDKVELYSKGKLLVLTQK